VDPKKYFDRMYEDYDSYIAIPVVLLLLSFALMGVSYMDNGSVLQLGQDFTGGTTVTYNMTEEFDTAQVEQIFTSEERPGSGAVRIESGESTLLEVTVPPPEMSESQLLDVMNNNSVKSYSLESSDIISRSFSTKELAEQLLMLASWTFILAFSIMSLAIFTSFRDLVPSLAVIFAAASDIIFSIGVMSFLNIPLTPGSLSALLMLIGYSVDTDIVLSSRVLKQKRGSIKDRVWSSMKTGVTMSSGGIAGFSILYLVSIALVGPSTLSMLASVMVIGLLADMPFTWFGNAYILKRYVEGDLEMPGKIEKVIQWR
jgi:preprotein translocase subunit SecF